MQYGVNAPFGLAPARTIQGNPWNGQTGTYVITNNGTSTTTGLFEGDPVIPTAAGTISQYPSTYSSPAPAALGVFQGAVYIDASNVPQFVNYIPNGTTFFANTLPVAKIIDDPYIVFQIQANNSSAIPSPAQNIIFSNIQLVNGSGANSGNAALGQSTFAANTSAIAVTTDYTLRILRYVPTADVATTNNVVINPTSSYVLLEVLLQNHFYNASKVGV